MVPSDRLPDLLVSRIPPLRVSCVYLCRMGTRQRKMVREHSHVILPPPRGTVSVTHGHVHLPQPRRVASFAHGLCAPSSIPKDRFRCTRSCTPSTIPKDRFRCTWSCTSSTNPKARFRRARRTFLPLPRRVASATYCLVFLPQLRRTTSVLRSVFFFHVPEGSFPFCTLCVSSTSPRGCFRHARPFFPSASTPKSTASV